MQGHENKADRNSYITISPDYDSLETFAQDIIDASWKKQKTLFCFLQLIWKKRLTQVKTIGLAP